MDKKIANKMHILVERLQKYADAYYNGESIVTDDEYDNLYNLLESMEKESGIVLSGSPTQKVGYEVKNELAKVTHESPMLSLDKVHSVQEIQEFMQYPENICVASVKEDGLTIRLTYKNGELVKAETRGDGFVGSDVLHNVKTFTNVPLTIHYSEDLIIDGEAIITDDVFQKINTALQEKGEKVYKNSRNLVSGTLSLLDANITKQRNVKFIGWRVVSGLHNKYIFEDFIQLEQLGFEVVPYQLITYDSIQKDIDFIKNQAIMFKHPYDGIVISFANLEYAKTLGRTEHHFNHSIAYKFEDETVKTVITDVEWSMGRTGKLTPVAVFKPVEIDGTTITRAGCHNVTYLANLQLGIGDEVAIYKANKIIPQIKKNYTNSANLELPKVCPICGCPTFLSQDNETVELMCSNADCLGKQINKIKHYVSQDCMNIMGMSENTIGDLFDNGLLYTIPDLYHLKDKKDEMVKIERFGPKKVGKLLQAIDDSRNCTLSKFITSLGIPSIGKTVSKMIAKECHSDFDTFYQRMEDHFDWTIYDGFGLAMQIILYKWWDSHKEFVKELSQYLIFDLEEIAIGFDNSAIKDLNGTTFCITGSLVSFKNRDELVADIEKHNGKVVSGVTKKTNYLINNDIESNSSKNKKAKELGIEIITEEKYLELVGDSNEI